MIAFVSGTLAYIDPTLAIVDVAGVGYELKIPLSTFEKIKVADQVHLHTHFHVTEDAHTLFGFASPAEKSMFRLLISISGVGPATALMALSTYQPSELRSAIAAENVKQIQGIKGIGGKTAQRIILELKDKIIKEDFGDQKLVPQLSTSANNTLKNEALSALITLGFNKTIGEKAIDQILLVKGKDISLEELIKQVLKSA
jgi:holliday junction DNA helicase RuvA